MTRVLQRHPLDLGNVLEPWLDAEIRDLVVPAIDQQSLDLDLVRVLPALPVLDGADDDELGWALAVTVNEMLISSSTSE